MYDNELPTGLGVTLSRSKELHRFAVMIMSGLGVTRDLRVMNFTLSLPVLLLYQRLATKTAYSSRFVSTELHSFLPVVFCCYDINRPPGLDVARDL